MRPVKIVKRLAQVVLGLVLGLIIAELVFQFRDHGAFPHVNFYEADSQLGLRLQPHAHMKLRVPGNPISEMTTNSLGFRGAQWPPPGDDEVLVVGDSQIFGLGVDDSQTFSAQWATLRHSTVLNAGVPTYGPAVYFGVVERVFEHRHPKRVIFVLNLANDLFEINRPNSQRHALWDGWAVRLETAPSEVVWFPGREWLMSQSHLVFALRTYLAKDEIAVDATVSEGTWKDIATAAKSTTPVKSLDEVVTEQLQKQRRVNDELEAVDLEIENRLEERAFEVPAYAKQLKAAGFLQDIVRTGATESGRPETYTARELLKASVALAVKTDDLRALATTMKDGQLVELVQTRTKLRSRLAELGGSAGEALTASDFNALFAKLQTLCDKHRAQLLVVALPLDVMVSDTEWAKYKVEPIDMRATSVLIADLRRRAESTETEFFDATETLRAAEPGAFLQGDLHMTAKGHAALAKALEERVNQPWSVTRSELELPPGRSWPPSADELAAVESVTVPGYATCQTTRVREWLRLKCGCGGSFGCPLVRVVRGGHGEIAIEPDQASFLVPFFKGDTVIARIGYEGFDRDSASFKADWAVSDEPTMRVGPGLEGKLEPLEPSSLVALDALSNPLRDEECEGNHIRAGSLRNCVTPCTADGGQCREGQVCYPWPSHSFCGAP